MKQEKVVITGGSGLVGLPLTKLLIKEGFDVVHLSRTKNSKGNVKVFLWDYSKEFIENGALDDCRYLIHLAGAGIADERWTFKRKKILILGGGQTAVYAASEFRKHNKESIVTIFSEEDYLPYERPPLSKDFLMNKK